MTTMTLAPTLELRAIDPLLIDLDPTQPRQELDADALDELTASVSAQGIVTPLRVVASANGRFQLLYGERRLRAALANELPTVPCFVSQELPSWTEALDIQLTENLHRAELRPLEIAQTLWRRILGANIAALEEEQGDDGSATAALLASALTPTSQIAALEDRLCALTAVGTVAEYFGSGRVRVSRKTILSRYGMAHWSESRLKKLFTTLTVDPAVQEMLSGIDVAARTLRELRKYDPATQAALVDQAKEQAEGNNGNVGAALRGMLGAQAGAARSAESGRQRAEPALVAAEDDAGEGDALGEVDAGDAPRSERAGAHAFTPDPALALLTTTHGHAPKLVTQQVAPQRGTAPPLRPIGVWSDDAVLMLESALETALTIFDDVGPLLHLAADQAQRIGRLWHELDQLMQHAQPIGTEGDRNV